MTLPAAPSLQLLLTALLTGALLTGCASPEQKPKPKSKSEAELKAQTIHLRSDPSTGIPGVPGQIVQKQLFNIVASPKAITVNGTNVKNLAALERLLAQQKQPAFTIAAHKCLSREKAAEIMNVVQRYADTPIAFGSYGKLDDPECN
ncbi:MAG: hypothetical protein NVV73_11985 [Cellvibrionaceae bacterium]|nr:hypothetical protein [Cellvibrionaceae bacterium]